MQHDIYSLGVCLLELGLRESFVVYTDPNGGGGSGGSGVGMLPSPSAALGLSNDSLQSLDPELIKDRLVSMAREVLPTRMGTRYAEIVETCLTCLDDDNVDFGDEDEFTDADGILVDARYVEKVVPSSPGLPQLLRIDHRTCADILFRLYWG
ncbi:uncharacterized protein PV07_10382 [Cladophialophora immunda]|uniref:Uncharacterized protein n=1 Tax=Cladophialophora immunda TaxID=569365 RepID=A0A0D2C2H9_9EURO|nr:uncharacterized protein PV07_10382 [Cladophialophora immunda]KIW24680.1 hypothetical protein PV07_10382 [Cladophialophora immunda]